MTALAAAAVLGWAVPARAQSPASAPAPAAADTAPVDTIYETVEEAPELLSRHMLARLVSHAYPENLRRMGTEGRVILGMVVEPDGRVRRGSLAVVSFTDPAFVEPARSVALGMRFRPAKVNGRAVPARVRLPIDFRLYRGVP
ncbi:MAG TPA: energy transducer TonB [Longimicrobium sp.]|jgi:protein TonB